MIRWIAMFGATGLIWFEIGGIVLVLLKPFIGSAIVLLVSSIGIGWGIQQLIGYYWFYERPWVSHPTHWSFIQTSPYSKSFPSDHAAIAFIGVGVSFIWIPHIFIPVIVCALCIAVSRVWVGVHRTIDVLSGATLGLLLVSFIHGLFGL